MEEIVEKLLEDFEHAKISRRQLIQSLALTAVGASAVDAAPTAADNELIKAVGINHISIQAPDYARERDFYVGLLGVQVLSDDGKSCSLRVGNTKILIRKPSVRRKAIQGLKVNHGSDEPGVDHISYTLANWDTNPKVEQAVRAELQRRGLPTGEDQIPGKSRTFHVNDLIGVGLQMGGKNQV